VGDLKGPHTFLSLVHFMSQNEKISFQRFEFESLCIDHNDDVPIFRQIENQIRVAIWEGRLKPRERLPSSRLLARSLGVARNTVVNAYEQLTLEGFVNSKKGSGTRVDDRYPQQMAPSSLKQTDVIGQSTLAPITLSSRYSELSSLELSVPNGEESTARPFRAHTPACNEFPASVWAQLAVKALNQSPGLWMEKNSPSGYFPLREAIASYLCLARGLRVTPEQVMVTAGAQQAVELLAKVLIEPDDVVVFEDPGYTHAAKAFQMAGANIINVPVDEQGLDIEYLQKTVKTAKLVYVTPANQFPMGVTLPLSRRSALLEWANQSGAIIVEDDYNGEYLYKGRPLTTLHAMAPDNHVVYVGSFSKLLFPALRLGYMIVPEQLLRPLETVRWLLDRHSPSLEQVVLSEFINQGYFARHLRRMRTLYALRQQALVDAAKKYWSNIMTVPPLDGGLHLVGYLLDGVEEINVLKAAELANLELMSTSIFCSRLTLNN